MYGLASRPASSSYGKGEEEGAIGSVGSRTGGTRRRTIG